MNWATLQNTPFQYFKHFTHEGGISTPLIEDILREINRGAWAAGYTGQSPERLKLHQQNWHTFHTTTLKGQGGPCDGEYYGLPWPCWLAYGRWRRWAVWCCNAKWCSSTWRWRTLLLW